MSSGRLKNRGFGMKKIVTLTLVMLITIVAVFAVEYVPVEESQRIRITGYEVNNREDYLSAYDENNICIEYVSAYSDIDYTIKQEPKTGKALYSSLWDAFYVSYAEKLPFRVEFKRDSNPDIIYYQDIEIPCKEPILANENVTINVYTGNTTEFGAVSGNDVYVQVLFSDEIDYSNRGDSSWFLIDGKDNLIKVGYDARDLEKDSPIYIKSAILNKEEAIAGKYKFCVEVFENSERKVAIKEFEIVD